MKLVAGITLFFFTASICSVAGASSQFKTNIFQIPLSTVNAQEGGTHGSSPASMVETVDHDFGYGRPSLSGKIEI